jgi:hypothetical protein
MFSANANNAPFTRLMRLLGLSAIAMLLLVSWGGLPPLHAAQPQTLMPYVVRFVQIVGAIAFCRSLMIFGAAIERHKASGVADGQLFARGLTHSLGGIGAMLIPTTAIILAHTFGG